MKIFRIIGREGRITIPWAIRQKIGFQPDDVVSFQLMEDLPISGSRMLFSLRGLRRTAGTLTMWRPSTASARPREQTS